MTDEKKWGNHSDNSLLIKAMKSSQKCANNREIFTKKKKIGQLVIFVKKVIRKSEKKEKKMKMKTTWQR